MQQSNEEIQFKKLDLPYERGWYNRHPQRSTKVSIWGQLRFYSFWKLIPAKNSMRDLSNWSKQASSQIWYRLWGMISFKSLRTIRNCHSCFWHLVELSIALTGGTLWSMLSFLTTWMSFDFLKVNKEITIFALYSRLVILYRTASAKAQMTEMNRI